MDSLSYLQFEVTNGFMQAGRQWQRLVEKVLVGYDVSSAGALPLLMIGRLGGGVRQVALAQHVGVEGPSMVRQLDKLCASGLVRREIDVSDRRANKLWLTEAGTVLAGQLEASLIALRAEVFAGIPASDMASALSVCQALSEAAKQA